MDGKKTLIAKDSKKTVSYIRTMPLSIGISKRLLEIKELQEVGKKRYKKLYNTQWDEYLIIDGKGNLISSNYITSQVIDC